MPWIDISQPLVPGMAVWPGDPPFAAEFTHSLRTGASYNVGQMSLGLHTGTHAESALHFEAEGPDIASPPLDTFLGPALVVEACGRTALDEAFVQHLDHLPSRLLFKTGTGIQRGWHEAFTWIEAAAAERLAAGGVRLLGIDSPSVDAARSDRWPAHRILARAGVVVLENLCLEAVQPGWYELVALPLNLPGREASPVRAALRRLPGPPTLKE